VGAVDRRQTRVSLVPARTVRELELLQDAARLAVLSGHASDWSLAAIGTRKRVRCWALVISPRAQEGGASPEETVAELAARVQTSWTLRIEDNRIVYADREGRLTPILEADSAFEDASPEPIPEEVSEELDPSLVDLDGMMVDWLASSPQA
jgi:hypothetical protein